MYLDAQGINLLSLLVSKLDDVVAGNPETYIGYKECHDLLGLAQVREKWGDSLKAQGLLNLAQWTQKMNKPAITGMIISKITYEPGIGYFSIFEREAQDYSWWREQIATSKEYDWSI